MLEYYKGWKGLKDLAGIRPEYEISAEIRMLPAGVLPVYGWLFQISLYSHVWVMQRKEPTVALETLVYLLLQ